MADVCRLSFHSLRFSSSLPTSSSFSFKTIQLGALTNHSSCKSIYFAGNGDTLYRPSKKFGTFKVNATDSEQQPKWWEKSGGSNMVDIHSTQEFLTSLSLAGDKLVIVDFYGTWCGSCRALLPKLCKTAEEHPEILFLKVNFDENKPMCKSLNVKVLPYFHFYRGADGQLESFSCSLAKFQKIKDAIILHNTERCSIGPPKGVGDLKLETTSASKGKQTESISA